MKYVSWYLFLIYFALFVLIGWLLYSRYINTVAFSGSSPITVENMAGPKLYYTEGNNLYQTDPSMITKDPLGEYQVRFQSTGEVTYLDVSKSNETVVYSAKNNKTYLEIWEVKTSNLKSERLTDLANEKLSGYLDFTRPKLAPDAHSVAFIGQNAEKESFFIENLDNHEIRNLADLSSQITDFSWDSTGSKIIICRKDPAKICRIYSVADLTIEKELAIEPASVNWKTPAGLFYIASGNVYLDKMNGSQPTALTNLATPKRALTFDLDREGTNVVYAVTDGTTSDIYTSKTDGTNLFQLTSDQKNTDPFLDPSGRDVVFLKQGDGIYFAELETKITKKVINLGGRSVKLLAWR